MDELDKQQGKGTEYISAHATSQNEEEHLMIFEHLMQEVHFNLHNSNFSKEITNSSRFRDYTTFLV